MLSFSLPLQPGATRRLGIVARLRGRRRGARRTAPRDAAPSACLAFLGRLCSRPRAAQESQPVCDAPAEKSSHATRPPQTGANFCAQGRPSLQRSRKTMRSEACGNPGAGGERAQSAPRPLDRRTGANFCARRRPYPQRPRIPVRTGGAAGASTTSCCGHRQSACGTGRGVSAGTGRGASGPATGTGREDRRRPAPPSRQKDAPGARPGATGGHAVGRAPGDGPTPPRAPRPGRR